MEYVPGPAGDIKDLNIDLFIRIDKVIRFREIMDSVPRVGLRVPALHLTNLLYNIIISQHTLIIHSHSLPHTPTQSLNHSIIDSSHRLKLSVSDPLSLFNNRP